MIFGSGNILSHATVDMSSGLEGTFGQGAMTELLFRSGYQEGYSDQAAKVMGDFANTSGSVLIAGNGNRSDYTAFPDHRNGECSERHGKRYQRQQYDGGIPKYRNQREPCGCSGNRK